jgi:outer membrane protein
MKMRKSILALIVLMSSFVFQAQASKIGYLNYANVIRDMPEYKTIQTKLYEVSDSLETEMDDLKERYYKKAEELELYVKAGPSKARMAELTKQEMQTTQMLIMQTEQDHNVFIQTREAALVKPLTDKVDKAVAEIVKEKGFTMIIDSSVLRYKRDEDDIEPMVRVKLNLPKVKAEDAKTASGTK